METKSENLNRDALSVPSPDPWEAAYLRFETPEQEIRKFVSRLGKLGAAQWSRDTEIVELFCGRGNGLAALERLGFTHIEGVDLSPRLIAQYRGPAKCFVGDCRQLLFADRSKDVLIVQGGLHHLPVLPDDLEETFSEMQRVLRKDGVYVRSWQAEGKRKPPTGAAAFSAQDFLLGLAEGKQAVEAMPVPGPRKARRVVMR